MKHTTLPFLNKSKMMHENFGGRFNCPVYLVSWLWA